MQGPQGSMQLPIQLPMQGHNNSATGFFREMENSTPNQDNAMFNGFKNLQKFMNIASETRESSSPVVPMNLKSFNIKKIISEFEKIMSPEFKTLLGDERDELNVIFERLKQEKDNDEYFSSDIDLIAGAIVKIYNSQHTSSEVKDDMADVSPPLTSNEPFRTDQNMQLINYPKFTGSSSPSPFPSQDSYWRNGDDAYQLKYFDKVSEVTECYDHIANLKQVNDKQNTEMYDFKRTINELNNVILDRGKTINELGNDLAHVKSEFKVLKCLHEQTGHFKEMTEEIEDKIKSEVISMIESEAQRVDNVLEEFKKTMRHYCSSFMTEKGVTTLLEQGMRGTSHNRNQRHTRDVCEEFNTSTCSKSNCDQRHACAICGDAQHKYSQCNKRHAPKRLNTQSVSNRSS